MVTTTTRRSTATISWSDTALATDATCTARTVGGGDTVIVGALCAGLQAVGSWLLERGLVREADAVAALVEHDAATVVFDGAANRWLDTWTFTGERPVLSVRGFVPKYRREDLGVWYRWQVGEEVVEGIYPVNLKDEPNASADGGRLRVGKRYGIFNRVSGASCSLRTNAPELFVGAATDAGGVEVHTGRAPSKPREWHLVGTDCFVRDRGAALGIGILAFVNDCTGRVPLAYDALHVHGMCGGSDLGPRSAAEPVASVLDDIGRFCTERHLEPTSAYDNEGLLLQANHHQAAEAFAYGNRRCIETGVYSSTLVQCFAIRFDHAIAVSTRARLATIERDLAAACEYL